MDDIINKLVELEKESVKRGIPIVGSEKGKWLADFIDKHKLQQILELGTANGYSGIILGHQGAELTTIEINDGIAEEAMKNYSEYNIDAKIIIGDGVEIVRDLTETKKDIFELIFIDFAKKKYIEVLENCIDMLKKDGYIIADNITMSGCQDFKEAVLNDERLETEMIDIKDGLSVSKITKNL